MSLVLQSLETFMEMLRVAEERERSCSLAVAVPRQHRRPRTDGGRTRSPDRRQQRDRQFSRNYVRDDMEDNKNYDKRRDKFEVNYSRTTERKDEPTDRDNYLRNKPSHSYKQRTDHSGRNIQNKIRSRSRSTSGSRSHSSSDEGDNPPNTKRSGTNRRHPRPRSRSGSRERQRRRSSSDDNDRPPGRYINTDISGTNRRMLLPGESNKDKR